jgi:hypothetical protein
MLNGVRRGNQKITEIVNIVNAEIYSTSEDIEINVRGLLK